MTDSLYCTVEPEFPLQAYASILVLRKNTRVYGLIPLFNLFGTIPLLVTYVRDMSENSEWEESVTIDDVTITLPLTYCSRFPLRKEFWNPSQVHFHSSLRLKTFLMSLLNTSWYTMLVTARGRDTETEKWILETVLPFPRSSQERDVERFMLMTDHPVDERSKSSAMYDIGVPFHLNWRTKSVSAIPAQLMAILKEAVH